MLFNGQPLKCTYLGSTRALPHKTIEMSGFFPNPDGEIAITSRLEIRVCNAARCSAFKVSISGNEIKIVLQCFSHHKLVNGFDCWQFVVKASRISQSYFCVETPTHNSLALTVWAASLSSPPADALVSRASRLHRLTLEALSRAWLTENKRETARSLKSHWPPVQKLNETPVLLWYLH